MLPAEEFYDTEDRDPVVEIWRAILENYYETQQEKHHIDRTDI